MKTKAYPKEGFKMSTRRHKIVEAVIENGPLLIYLRYVRSMPEYLSTKTPILKKCHLWLKGINYPIRLSGFKGLDKEFEQIDRRFEQIFNFQ